MEEEGRNGAEDKKVNAHAVVDGLRLDVCFTITALRCSFIFLLHYLCSGACFFGVSFFGA